jgi:hypothetical protein
VKCVAVRPQRSDGTVELSGCGTSATSSSGNDGTEFVSAAMDLRAYEWRYPELQSTPAVR